MIDKKAPRPDTGDTTTAHVLEWSIDIAHSERGGTLPASCGNCRGDGDISLDETPSGD